MIPLTFLTVTLLITLVAFVLHLAARRDMSARLQKLATKHCMQYAEHDLFQITPRVIERFPIPGASDLRIGNVVYRRAGARYRYVFTIEYTLGVVRTKERISRAGTFCEPHDRACPADWSNLVLAPENLCLPDQYALLCQVDPPAAK
jgi:hypothetical protein